MSYPNNVHPPGVFLMALEIFGMILWIKHGLNADPNKTHHGRKFRDDGVKVMILLTFQVSNNDLMLFSWKVFVFIVRHCVLPGKPETLSVIMMYLPYF